MIAERTAAFREDCRRLQARHEEEVEKRNQAACLAIRKLYPQTFACQACRVARKQTHGERCRVHELDYQHHVAAYMQGALGSHP